MAISPDQLLTEMINRNTYVPNPAWIPIHCSEDRIRIIFGHNQTGKTHGGVGDLQYHLFGEYPEWYPDEAKLPQPCKLRVMVSDFKKGFNETLRLKMDELIPESRIKKTYKIPDGTPYKYDYKNKSTLDVVTDEQHVTVVEGWVGHGVYADEPFSEDKFAGIWRGLMRYSGKFWATLTITENNPKGFWFVKRFLNAWKGGGEPNDAIAPLINCFFITRDDNPHVSERSYDQFEAMLSAKERAMRLSFEFDEFLGTIYPELILKFHGYSGPRVPSSGWTPVEGIDPHDARPTKWLFGAILPEEFIISGKTRNRILFYDYISVHAPVSELVAQAKAKRAYYGYQHPIFVALDAKYGRRTQMVKEDQGYETKNWQEELEKCGIRNIRLSQSKPGDVEFGHTIVREYLKPQYSSLLGMEKPGILFHKEGCGPAYRDGTPIYQMLSYQRDENGKPKEEEKDFPDAVRYILMEQPRYKDPMRKKQMRLKMDEQYKKLRDSRQHSLDNSLLR